MFISILTESRLTHKKYFSTQMFTFFNSVAVLVTLNKPCRLFQSFNDTVLYWQIDGWRRHIWDKFKSGTGFRLGINIFNQSTKALENRNEKLTLKNVGFRTMDIRSQSFIWSVSGNVFVIVKDEILFNIFVTIQILFEECSLHRNVESHTVFFYFFSLSTTYVT